MEYKLSISRISVSHKVMTISVTGEFIDKSINPKFLSTPKVVMHFDNGIEDRRIPIVIRRRNITYVDGKCVFFGSYEYRLDCIFWKSKGKNIPFDMYFNISFADFYQEKVHVNIDSGEYIQDKKFFEFTSKDNHFTFKKNAKNFAKDKLKASLVVKTNKFLKFLLFICSVIFIPFFILEGFVAFSDYVNMPNKITSNNKLKRLMSYVIYRMSVVSRKNISVDAFKRSLIRIMFKIMKHKKVVNNRITFFSARRNEISGNFEFVYNKIKDDKNLDIKFLFNTKSFREMSLNDIKEFAEACATSKVIVLDEYTPQIHLIDLKSETKLVQLWHACGAFKTFGFTRLGKPKGSPQPTRNHRSYDYVTVSSEYCKKCHSEGFGIATKNVVPTGIARTDIFFDEKYISNFKNNFYSEYPNLKNKKIILFAPTFRGDLKADAHYPMDLFDVSEVCSSLGEEYAIIIKHHPFIKKKHPIPEEYKDRVIDLSESTEINDLLFVSDLVITDYSSLVFEASLVDVPMLFYAYDLLAYIRSRDFYFDYKLYIPGKICGNLTELLSAIQEKDFKQEKIKAFRDMFFDNLDGKSTDRIVDLLYKCLEQKK